MSKERERVSVRKRDKDRGRHIWIVDPERVSVRKRDKDRGRHIWIVDPPYSRLRRSVIGLPCKIGLKKNGVKYFSDQEQYLKHHT